ncbi:DUF1304 domain-containing protein [Curtobacterium ammoniigenes]|uniref:DUF1304 domain-containing protein n=1 Tax=Curtobacterium ammoniigenes TaxID=395387 RepID=UPI000837318A|nr:DUF1304 domain-containing protein [Curtobacterium ammoniigenes]
MLLAGIILAGLSAALHVVIFWLESVVWGSPRANRTFGVAAADVETTRALAFNQGFYNLFLAVGTFVGIAAVGIGAVTVGVTLVVVGTGSMLAAASVLFSSSPNLRRAAVVQGSLPALALLATVIAIAVVPGG